jgi:uncharacterized protein
MKRLMTSAAHYPWLVFTLITAITLAAASQLAGLRIEIAAQGLMVNQPKLLAEHNASLKAFGSDAITVIYLEDDDLFAPGNLSTIRQVVRDIEALPQISRTTSLFSTRYLRTQAGYVFTGPYLENIPETSAARQKIIDAALLNPLIERNLLSRDGTAMAINLYLDMSHYHRGFDEKVTEALDHALAPLQSRLRHAFHLGDPSIRSAISQQIRRDLKVILPLSLLVLILTLWLILKRSYVALIPLLTAGVSVVWTLGAMAMLAIPIHVMTAIIPALLIIIGSTEDIHLISEYQAGMKRGMGHLLSTQYMANHMGTAVLLTFFTTCLGFLSITLCRIELLQQFGLMTAIGLCLNFIITVTLIPACLSLASRYANRESDAAARYNKVMEGVFTWVSVNRRLTVIGLTLLLALGAYWSTHIEINNNVMAYFPASSPIPEEAAKLHKNLSGIQSLTLLLSGENEAFLKVGNLRELKKLQSHLEEIGLFDKSFSFADFVSVIHNGINGEETSGSDLPQKDEIVSEYLSLLGHSSARSFISEDYNQARIIVRHDIASSKRLNQAVASVVNYARESLDPSLELKVTGSSYLNSLAVDYMADGQAQTLLAMLGLIFLIVSLQLSNAKFGLIAVISNLFPITLLFGVMGYFNLPLDTSTVMVAAITLGICVDHTMHFMVRYQRLLQDGRSLPTALLQTIRQESLPIVTTSLALTLGFATLACSSFPPVARFGLLSALVMLLALISTFVVTPLILQFTGHKAGSRILPPIIQRHPKSKPLADI